MLPTHEEVRVELDVDLTAVGLGHLHLVKALLVAGLGGSDGSPTGECQRGLAGLGHASPVIGVPSPSSGCAAPIPVPMATAAAPTAVTIPMLLIFAVDRLPRTT